jgi:hypothetical protein
VLVVLALVTHRRPWNLQRHGSFLGCGGELVLAASECGSVLGGGLGTGSASWRGHATCSAESTHLVLHGDQEAGVLVRAVVHISAVVAAPELDLFDVEAGRTQVNLL